MEERDVKNMTALHEGWSTVVYVLLKWLTHFMLFFHTLVYLIFRTVTLMAEGFDFREHLTRSEHEYQIYEKWKTLGKVRSEKVRDWRRKWVLYEWREKEREIGNLSGRQDCSSDAMHFSLWRDGAVALLALAPFCADIFRGFEGKGLDLISCISLPLCYSANTAICLYLSTKLSDSHLSWQMEKDRKRSLLIFFQTEV